MLNLNNAIYEVTEKKTAIKGFWKDKGKIFIDNIILYHWQNVSDFQSKLDLLFLREEKAVFIRTKEKSFIISQDEENKVLSHSVSFWRDKLSFNEIKSLINNHGGLTIFKTEGKYFIEIWRE